MRGSYILSIDQGTSGTKTIVVNAEGAVVARASVPLTTFYPEGGRVEQNPEAIVQNVLDSVAACLLQFQASGMYLKDIRACGISNQRETFVIWDQDGKPLYNAVVWQCKRSVHICERLKAAGLADTIKAKTGLVTDPYFSSSKVIWLYENVETVRAAIDTGNAFFGTVDTWLLFRLTHGGSYYTDLTNASRTMFFHLSELTWDKELLATFNLSGLHLPIPKPSSSDFGESDFNGLFPAPVPITAMIGDSHAAAFGEGCFSAGTAKATLGTGCSILMNTGSQVKPSANGMVNTICWSTDNRVDYALEGVIVSCGATVEWLRTELNLFENSAQTEAMAKAVADNNGVYIIPSFSGMGAPYWDMNRKASISGLTFGSGRNHIVRAALESIPYQIRDVIQAMEQDAGLKLGQLMTDGGITANSFVMQFLTDLLNKPVVNIGLPDVSALGAAYLAGLKAGIFSSLDYLQALSQEKRILYPGEGRQQVEQYYEGWKNVMKRGI